MSPSVHLFTLLLCGILATLQAASWEPGAGNIRNVRSALGPFGSGREECWRCCYWDPRRGMCMSKHMRVRCMESGLDCVPPRRLPPPETTSTTTSTTTTTTTTSTTTTSTTTTTITSTTTTPVSTAATPASNGSPTSTAEAGIPENLSCGLSKAMNSGYSFHGDDAKMFDHPWQAFLLITFPSSTFPSSCGGSLIDNRTVLTAAHCFYKNREWPVEAAMVEVRLGDHNVTAISARQSELIYNLTKDRIEVHPDYNHFGQQLTFENDIAKVYLSEPVNFTSHPWINPICLADPNRDYTGSNATATGWGWVARMEMAEVLQEVQLDILSSYACSKVPRAHEKMICTQDKKARMCYGDSGGPLSVVRTESDPEQRELLGILSHGSTNKCRVEDVPDIFTDVTKYMAWINERNSLICKALDSNGQLIDSNCMWVAVSCAQDMGCPGTHVFYTCTNTSAGSGYSEMKSEYILLCSAMNNERCAVHTEATPNRCRQCCISDDCGDRLPKCSTSSNGISVDYSTRHLTMKVNVRKLGARGEYNAGGAHISLSYQGRECVTSIIPTSLPDPVGTTHTLVLDTQGFLATCWGFDVSQGEDKMEMKLKLPVNSPIAVSTVQVIDSRDLNRCWTARWRSKDGNYNKQTNQWVSSTRLYFDDECVQ